MMALVVASPGLPPPRQTSYSEEEDMSTIPDPRSRAITPANDGTSKNMHHHPDLSDEVATLSTKLINAINYQTNLDDTLSATRCELDSSRDRLQQLEAKVKTYDDQISQGILVEKTVADAEKVKAITELEEERKRRIQVEKEKKDIELELETLTTALFEEANNMVTSAREEARKELDVANRRSEQLKTQVADTEALLKSHQEQLAQLKTVMEHMSDDRTNSTAPPTPGLSKVDSREHFGVDSLDNLAISEDLPPSYPTSFTHLLHPVLRTDIASYDEFISLVRLAKASSSVPGSRVSSGSYGSFGIGLGLYNKNPPSTQAPSNTSTSSVSTGTSPVTPNTPLSATSAASVPASSSIPLNDTKFYKRALAEDIEPCLRLDTAPGISWMARRSMLKSMCEGNLVVEPMPASTKKFSLPFSCSLCGENRGEEDFGRNHRFRISESNNAQRYPLCRYCLGRIRSSCDFVGFLRMLKDGHWRAEGEEAEKAAWEESVRLREQMFWCRMGGGVRPGPHPPLSKDDRSSPRTSEDERREQEAKISEEFSRTGEIQPKDVTPVAEPNTASPSTEADSTGTSIKSRRPSTSTASIKSLTSTSSGSRPSLSIESRKPSTSSETKKPSTSMETKKPLTPTEPKMRSVSTPVKRTIPTEAKKPFTPDFKRPSIETKRPSTGSSEKPSKVLNIRMMFEKKKDTTDDAAAPATIHSKSTPEKTTITHSIDTPEKHSLTRDSSQATLNANSLSPGDSSSDQQLAITIPGSFD